MVRWQRIRGLILLQGGAQIGAGGWVPWPLTLTTVSGPAPNGGGPEKGRLVSSRAWGPLLTSTIFESKQWQDDSEKLQCISTHVFRSNRCQRTYRSWSCLTNALTTFACAVLTPQSAYVSQSPAVADVKQNDRANAIVRILVLDVLPLNIC